MFAEGLTEEKYITEVSLYPKTHQEVQNRSSSLRNTDVKLIPGDSTKLVPRIPKNMKFDVIHIDGGHSFATVLKDWHNVVDLMDSHTAVFFDDYCNPIGVSKGGFGVKDVVDRINSKQFKVKSSKNRDYFWKPYGLLSLRMAMVQLRKK